MAGRVAVVTGGTRGIGAAVSRMLKDKGYKVAATYAGNDGAANKFKAETGIAVYKFDVGDFAAVTRRGEMLREEAVDVLIANSGISGGEMSVEHVDAADAETPAPSRTTTGSISE